MAEDVTDSDLVIHERQQKGNKKKKNTRFGESGMVGSFTNNWHKIVINYFYRGQHMWHFWDVKFNMF